MTKSSRAGMMISQGSEPATLWEVFLVLIDYIRVTFEIVVISRAEILGRNNLQIRTHVGLVLPGALFSDSPF